MCWSIMDADETTLLLAKDHGCEHEYEGGDRCTLCQMLRGVVCHHVSHAEVCIDGMHLGEHVLVLQCMRCDHTWDPIPDTASCKCTFLFRLDPRYARPTLSRGGHVLTHPVFCVDCDRPNIAKYATKYYVPVTHSDIAETLGDWQANSCQSRVVRDRGRGLLDTPLNSSLKTALKRNRKGEEAEADKRPCI